ncbi:FAD-binding oxidoreductase [soil metagenome]
MSQAHSTLPTTRRAVTDDEIDRLREGFRGPLYRPGDDGYDPGDGPGRQGEHYGRFLWNGRFADARPALIARPTTAADVITLVNFAREGGWHPAVRGGGHNTGGPAAADDDIVLDLSLMRHVRVDPHARRARVGGGATWWDLDRNTQVFGLACVGGAIAHTGVVGLALGGGHGKLTRKYGMTADTITGADVVTADGRLHVVDAEHEPDLFWAIRGGGGNFGVVTSLEVALHPVRDVWLDMTWWPAEQTADVLTFWKEWSRNQPPELATSSIVVNAPTNRGFAEHLVGRRFVAVTSLWHGDLADAEAVLRPMREFGAPEVKISRATTYDVVQTMNDGIANADYGFRNYTKTGYLSDLSDEAIATYAAWAVDQPTKDGLVELIAVDGPMNDVALHDTPLGARSARFNHIIASGWTDPHQDERQMTWVRDFHAAMAPFYDAGVYVNYLDRGEAQEVIASAYGDNWGRLRQLKARFDPGNLFRRNQNIPPADPSPGVGEGP